mmetsp:Transcript_24876/g.63489  ORF Transcript_24876/g.63489 Transcript_24876/m.63489 type:complete len:231 (-) Transcript_24876:710-1402(-)
MGRGTGPSALKFPTAEKISDGPRKRCSQHGLKHAPEQRNSNQAPSSQDNPGHASGDLNQRLPATATEPMHGTTRLLEIAANNPADKCSPRVVHEVYPGAKSAHRPQRLRIHLVRNRSRRGIGHPICTRGSQVVDVQCRRASLLCCVAQDLLPLRPGVTQLPIVLPVNGLSPPALPVVRHDAGPQLPHSGAAQVHRKHLPHVSVIAPVQDLGLQQVLEIALAGVGTPVAGD